MQKNGEGELSSRDAGSMGCMHFSLLLVEDVPSCFLGFLKVMGYSLEL